MNDTQDLDVVAFQVSSRYVSTPFLTKSSGSLSLLWLHTDGPTCNGDWKILIIRHCLTNTVWQILSDRHCLTDIWNGECFERNLILQGFATLLGSVGGNLGLWIGASIFTIIEFIYGFFGFAFALFQQTFKKSNHGRGGWLLRSGSLPSWHAGASNYLWRPLSNKIDFPNYLITLSCKVLCMNWFVSSEEALERPHPPMTPYLGEIRWYRLRQKSWTFCEHCEVSGVCKWVHSALLPDRHRSSRQGHHYATMPNQHIYTYEIMIIT